MFTTLPVTMLYSILLWAAILYTLMGCAQLILFDMSAKRENPKARKYSQMSEANKRGIRRSAIKITFGLLSLIALAIADRFIIL